MYEWVFAAVIVFAASVLQSATGFGFAIMATPFLLMVFDSRDVIQMSIILSFVIAILLIAKIRHEIDKGMLKRLILGSVFGVPIGLLFFAYVSLDVLKVSVSIVIIIITFFLLYKWYYNHYKNNQNPVESEKYSVDARNATLFSLGNATNRKELIAGLFAGMFTASIGMPGVPLAIYYNSNNIKKEVIRSTTLAFFIFVYIFSMISQWLTVKIGSEVLTPSLLLIPAVAAGVLIGNLLFYRINQKMFQLIANGILLYTGFYMLIKAV